MLQSKQFFQEILNSGNIGISIQFDNKILELILDLPYQDLILENSSKFMLVHRRSHNPEGLNDLLLNEISPHEKERALIVGNHPSFLNAVLKQGYITHALIKYTLPQKKYLNSKETLSAAIDAVITMANNSSAFHGLFYKFIDDILMKSSAFNLDHLEKIMHYYFTRDISDEVASFYDDSYSSPNQLNFNYTNFITVELLERLLLHKNIKKELREVSPTKKLLLNDLFHYLANNNSLKPVKKPLRCSQIL